MPIPGNRPPNYPEHHMGYEGDPVRRFQAAFMYAIQHESVVAGTHAALNGNDGVVETELWGLYTIQSDGAGSRDQLLIVDYGERHKAGEGNPRFRRARVALLTPESDIGTIYSGFELYMSDELGEEAGDPNSGVEIGVDDVVAYVTEGYDTSDAPSYGAFRLAPDSDSYQPSLDQRSRFMELVEALELLSSGSPRVSPSHDARRNAERLFAESGNTVPVDTRTDGLRPNPRQFIEEVVTDKLQSVFAA